MGKKGLITSALYEGITLIAPNYSKHVLQQIERERWRSDFERRLYELKHRLRVELRQLEWLAEGWSEVERLEILYRLYRKARQDGRTAMEAYYKAVQHLSLGDRLSRHAASIRFSISPIVRVENVLTQFDV